MRQNIKGSGQVSPVDFRFIHPLFWQYHISAEDSVKGWQIFQHSVRQVTRNLPEALQVSAVPFAISLMISLGSGGQMMAFQTDPNTLSLGASLSMLAGVIVMVVVSVWVAVAWHRYVLMNERPKNFLPAFHGDRSWAYFLRSLGYGVLLMAVMLVVSLVLGMLFMGQVPQSNGFGMRLVIGLAFQIPLLTVAFRLMAALPATALGHDSSFMAGWQATRGHSGDILALAVICAVLSTLIGVVGGAVLEQFSILLIAFDVVFNWFVTMIGASILTTLYGHYIQGRPLV